MHAGRPWYGMVPAQAVVQAVSMSECVAVYNSPRDINAIGEKEVWRADAVAPSHVAPHLVRMAAPVNQTAAAVVWKPPRPVNLHDSLSSLSLNYGAGFIPQLICTWIQLVGCVTYSSSRQCVHHSPTAWGRIGEGCSLWISNHIHIWWLILSLAGLSELMWFPYWIMQNCKNKSYLTGVWSVFDLCMSITVIIFANFTNKFLQTFQDLFGNLVTRYFS